MTLSRNIFPPAIVGEFRLPTVLQNSAGYSTRTIEGERVAHRSASAATGQRGMELAAVRRLPWDGRGDLLSPSGRRPQDRGRRIEHAKVICHNCPVMTECRQHALATREPYGIWGACPRPSGRSCSAFKSFAIRLLRQSRDRPVPTGDDRLGAQAIGHLSRRPQTDPAPRTYPENVEATGIGTRDRFTSTTSPADHWKDTHQ